MANSPDRMVRGKVLRAAEQLFAERGLNVSVREITEAAGVNVASVSYYFGSKTGLAHAVFDTLAERVNGRRLAQIERLASEALEETKSPDLRELLRVFIRPYFDPRKDENGQLLAQLIFQHRSTPTEFTRDIVKRHFDPMARRFIEALQLACPAVPSEEMIWRYSFLVGAVVLNVPDLGPEGRVARLSNGRLKNADVDEIIERLVRFLAAGIAACGPRSHIKSAPAEGSDAAAALA
jgi:AcrR family transcriptional regulator